jgi:hypothetical protein
MRAKLEPACDIGNLIVPVDPQQIRASRMPKRQAAPFGARTGTDGRCRAPSGRAGNKSRPNCVRISPRPRQRQSVTHGPARMPCPSPRHLPILAAGRALSAGVSSGFQAAGVYVPDDGGSSGCGEGARPRGNNADAFSVFDGGGTVELPRPSRRRTDAAAT